MNATAVAPGSHWRRKRMDGHTPRDQRVFVVRATGGDKVVVQRADGQRWDMPVNIFLGTYAPESNGACQRCGSGDLRHAGDKYCRDCLSLIGRVKNARKHEEEEVVLTTTDSRVIEQRQQTPVRAEPVPEPEPKETQGRWRIRGRRWVVEEVIVEGATVIDALANLDAQNPDLQITDVHLLDGQSRPI